VSRFEFSCNEASPDDESSVLSKRRVVYFVSTKKEIVQNHVGDVS